MAREELVDDALGDRVEVQSGKQELAVILVSLEERSADVTLGDNRGADYTSLSVYIPSVMIKNEC